MDRLPKAGGQLVGAFLRRITSALARINLDDQQGAIDFMRKCDRNWRV